MSTLASDRATRSTSSCRAIIAALRPINWTCVFERIADIGLTRAAVSSTNMSFAPSPRHEAFDQLAQVGAESDKRGTEAIPRRPHRCFGNALHLNVRPERRAVQVQPEIPCRAGGHFV